MRLGELENKEILILGFGREGKDSYAALKKLFPQKKIGLTDEKKNGKDYLKAVRDYNLILKTPGIPKRLVRPFLAKGAKITSQTEIFFDNCCGEIIGITGTKGKGTTASLIYQILKKAGAKVHLIGNIGRPVFQMLLKSSRDHTFVYELSSHQLQSLKKSPHIAVFLNFFPDHLDYYRNLKEYQRAKENITLYQTKNDFFIYNKDDKIVREIAKKTKAKKIPFGLDGKKKIAAIIELKDIPLKGEFNLLNVQAAIAVVELFNISKAKIKAGIKEFKALAHRLEFVGRFKGIDFYDDSMSTIPEVTMAALDALKDKVKTLIVGGSDKGSNYRQLAKKILQSNLRTLIIFPGTGKKVWQEIQRIKKRDLPEPFFVNSMKEAVKMCYQKTSRGEVCLLSPGAASFNLFADYQERGNLFKRYVKNLGQSNFSYYAKEKK